MNSLQLAGYQNILGRNVIPSEIQFDKGIDLLKALNKQDTYTDAYTPPVFKTDMPNPDSPFGAPRSGLFTPVGYYNNKNTKNLRTCEPTVQKIPTIPDDKAVAQWTTRQIQDGYKAVFEGPIGATWFDVSNVDDSFRGDETILNPEILNLNAASFLSGRQNVPPNLGKKLEASEKDIQKNRDFIVYDNVKQNSYLNPSGYYYTK